MVFENKDYTDQFDISTMSYVSADDRQENTIKHFLQSFFQVDSKCMILYKTNRDDMTCQPIKMPTEIMWYLFMRCNDISVNIVYLDTLPESKLVSESIITWVVSVFSWGSIVWVLCYIKLCKYADHFHII